MDLDEQELKETRKRKGLENKIQKVIRNRIDEINNEEWFIPDEKNIKFYCIEELEKVMFRLLKED